MSGKSVSVVLRYGVDREGNFTLNKGMVWPLLRTVPNNTHASLMRRSAWNPLDAVFVNSRSLTEEKVESISLNGILTVESRFDKGYYGQWKLIREYFPSTDQPALIEKYSLINTGKNSLQVEITEEQTRFENQSGKRSYRSLYHGRNSLRKRPAHSPAGRYALLCQLPCPPHREGEPSVPGCNRKQKGQTDGFPEATGRQSDSGDSRSCHQPHVCLLQDPGLRKRLYETRRADLMHRTWRRIILCRHLGQ